MNPQGILSTEFGNTDNFTGLSIRDILDISEHNIRYEVYDNSDILVYSDSKTISASRISLQDYFTTWNKTLEFTTGLIPTTVQIDSSIDTNLLFTVSSIIPGGSPIKNIRLYSPYLEDYGFSYLTDINGDYLQLTQEIQLHRIRPKINLLTLQYTTQHHLLIPGGYTPC